MDLARPLQVITPSVDGDVLTQLALADAWFTTGRLRRAMEMHSEDGIRRALKRLVQQGIVVDEQSGNAVLYRLNRRHLASRPIIELANAWARLVEKLGDELQLWSARPKVAAMYGSAARGTMTAESDIDIMLVRPSHAVDGQWVADVRRLAADAGDWTGNDVRIVEFTEEHVLSHAGDEPVLHDVAIEGVRLDGDIDWLRRVLTRVRLGRVP